jgi:excisionase family DNA binding protein
MANENDRILVGRRDAALLLSVSPRTIDNLIRAKRIRPRRIGARVLFLRTELEAFARGAQVEWQGAVGQVAKGK